ncbi:hypothetical protein BHE74_00051511 [Ensete ventricosum]|nr:hypothetical protein BHE74_00051511 [Ensete ventricosum]
MTTFFFVELQSHSIACLLYMWLAGTHRLGLAWLYSFVGDHHMAMEAGEESGSGEVSLAHGEEEKNEGGETLHDSLFKADRGVLFIASHTDVTRFFFSGVCRASWHGANHRTLLTLAHSIGNPTIGSSGNIPPNGVTRGPESRNSTRNGSATTSGCENSCGLPDCCTCSVAKPLLRSGEVEESLKGGSSFTPEIQDKPLPTNFILPALELYDGNCDPTEHVATFRAQMAL